MRDKTPYILVYYINFRYRGTGFITHLHYACSPRRSKVLCTRHVRYLQPKKKWCVQDMQVIYDQDSMTTEWGRFMLKIIEEPRLRIDDLVGIPSIKATLDKFRLSQIRVLFGYYSLELVCEFSVVYVASVDLLPLWGRNFQTKLHWHILW